LSGINFVLGQSVPAVQAVHHTLEEGVLSDVTMIIMVALWNRADHYIFALWFLSFFLFFLA